MMIITVEISYYPLQDSCNKAIDEFILDLGRIANIQVVTGIMSSTITGEYSIVMNGLVNIIYPYMEKYPSVFNIKISNACFDCSTPVI